MIIQFKEDHQKEGNQLFIAISSSNPATIKEKLMNIAGQINVGYGKPIQGIVIDYDSKCEVITPKWNNKEF